MLENKRSRVYCFCAVRSNQRSSRSAPKTRSSEARTMTEIGLFSTNLSNTSPSMRASLLGKIETALSYTKSPHLYTTGTGGRISWYGGGHVKVPASLGRIWGNSYVFY